MTRFKYVSIAIFICTILQTTLAEYLSVFNVKPALLVAVAVCAVLDFGILPGAVTGVVCGLILDITSGRGVGIGCGLLCHRIFKEKIIAVMLFTFVSDFLFGFLYSFFLLFAWGKGDMGFILLNRLLPEATLTAIAAIPVFLIFKKVKSAEWTNN